MSALTQNFICIVNILFTMYIRFNIYIWKVNTKPLIKIDLVNSHYTCLPSKFCMTCSVFIYIYR